MKRLLRFGLRFGRRRADWLERHWVNPAYAGWLLVLLAIFFFGAATNTMAGWLYVISGTLAALLGMAAVLARRSLRSLAVARSPLAPVGAGDGLSLELTLTNAGDRPQGLLQVRDNLPESLGGPQVRAVELVPDRGSYCWTYAVPAAKRGIYTWSQVVVRGGAPFGLFWARRDFSQPARAIVYPQILPLARCPWVDRLGQAADPRQLRRDRENQFATEGVTRSLRPYRWGDPIRLVHWRTSARYGELRVRELETATGGQDLTVALDSAAPWDREDFEQAAIVAASLHRYASRRQIPVSLWTAGTGRVRGNRAILTALAAVDPAEPARFEEPPPGAVLWLTGQGARATRASADGDGWLLWTEPGAVAPAIAARGGTGRAIDRDRTLAVQLQESC